MSNFTDILNKYRNNLANLQPLKDTEALTVGTEIEEPVIVESNEMITFYSPNQKFGVHSFTCKAKYKQFKDGEKTLVCPDGWLYLTQEQLDGLANKTLVWTEDNRLEPYTKTDAEILVEVAEEKAKRASAEIAKLQAWLDKVYDAQIKQAQRCERLGVPYDNKYGTVAELDTLAAEKAERIRELRESLK